MNTNEAEYAIIKIRKVPLEDEYEKNVEIYFEDKDGNRLKSEEKKPIEKHPIEVNLNYTSGGRLYFDQATWIISNEMFCIGFNGWRV